MLQLELIKKNINFTYLKLREKLKGCVLFKERVNDTRMERFL